MNPVAALLASLDEQLIVILLRAVRDVQQNVRIAEGLLDACASDIHSATRQMIRGRRSTCQLIHLRRAIPRGNDNRFITIAIQRTMAVSEILQPLLANPAKILYRHTTRDISIRRLYTRLRNLPELKVLGEVQPKWSQRYSGKDSPRGQWDNGTTGQRDNGTGTF